MKKQLISFVTIISMTLSPLAAIAEGGEGTKPPKHKCDKGLVKSLWESDRTDLKKEFRNYWNAPAADRQWSAEEFCDSIANAFDKEAEFCAPGECRKKAARNRAKEEAEAIVEAADAPPPRAKVYREDHGPAVVSGGAQRGGVVMGSGDNSGMMMGMMMMMMLPMLMGGGNRGGMMGGPMFPPPRGGPWGPPPPFMPANTMGMRPPPYMPLQRPMFGGGQFPYSTAMAGGMGYPGYGGVAQYNGAQIYNAGFGGYGGAGAYSQNYFNNPGPAPAIINPVTGMRTYSVLGR